ncbi:MAG: RyR domain-containing protein [Clostridium sp.]|nr:RyR domain-containing protein [Clostridium sp.]
MKITNELLSAYAEGNVSQEERLAVRQYLTENPGEWDSMLMMMDEDYDITLDDEEIESPNIAKLDNNLGELLSELDSQESTNANFRILPAMAMAAENRVDNLCVIHCEGIALRRFGFEISDEELLNESRKEGWLQPSGTALHNIGRLVGSHGLGVSHRYECTIDDIQESLTAGHIVLAAVDANELIGDYEKEKAKDLTEGETPNHVVIVESLDNQNVTITDSATPQQHDTYPIAQFLDAWADSSNYLIIISDGEEYEPHPIDLSDVEISDDLIELREAIAENAHEVWAYNRKQEGWTYGPERDDQKKLHPDMIAYNQLPESEKLYDREMAMNTIKLLKKLGWELSKSKK